MILYMRSNGHFGGVALKALGKPGVVLRAPEISNVKKIRMIFFCKTNSFTLSCVH